MKRKIIVILLALSFVVASEGRLEAALPTFDAVNAALNEIRNGLMQSQFAQDIALAMERLHELKATYLELLRFHAGLDDFFEVVMGDPVREIFRQGRRRARDAFLDLEWFTPKVEVLEGATGPQDIRRALEEITGPLPDSEARPYIPFEEMQVVDGFHEAQEIRNAGVKTRDAARQIGEQAKIASPKGAARLGVQATTQMMLLAQENQEALAKIIELEATQVEQTSREEKRYERERERHMDEMRQGIETLWEVR